MAELTKQLERARRSLEKNKLRDAVEEYQAVFDEAPSNHEAILALGDLYVRLNEPVRAAHYYGLQFDRLLDSNDTAKAAAIYARFLRGVPQPAERLIRYAVQLQKQNRIAEAVEQYTAAAERYHEMNQEAEALGCYEKISQLDSENPNRHLSVAELAEKLGQKELASHSYLRAGQLCQSLGEIDLALEYFRHAHELAPNDRTVALFFAEARLRHGNPAGAVELLDPFADGESDTTFLALFGEGLLRTGQLDRARDAFVAFYRQKQDGFTKMFELAGAYIRTGQDEKGADVLQVTKEWMRSVRRENEFAAQVDRMATVYPNSLELAKLVAQLYEELNRETKYFDSLVHLFDLYFDAGTIKAACDVLDRLVDIDPYDYRNHQRIAKLQGKADPAFLKNILARAAKAASVITRPEGFNAGGTRGERPAPQQEEHKAQQALDDLIVQVEIFLQYSLHAKAVERLEKIAEIFPDEEEKNERLHNLFDRANWWPKGKKKPAPAKPVATVAPGIPAASPAAPVGGILGFDVDTQRDLSQISEFTRLMYRQATPREVVTAAAQEIGKYLNVSRCVVEINGGKDEEPVTAEFTGPGIVPAASAQISSIVAMLETSPPDTLGGIELSGPGLPTLRELKLETVLGVRLVDKETRAPSGAVLVGSERMRQWRPNDSFFLQAVGDQILISANHTRTQAVVRTMAFADEKTGLVSRGAYVACLLAESSRARAQNTPVSLVILHVDGGGELIRQHGDAAFEKYIEQLARSLRSAVRQTDLAVKYTAWSLAFILPDTNAGSAKLLAEKLRLTATAVQAPWNGEGLSLSAVIAEAAYRPSDDNEDRVTEWINRAEAGLDEVRQQLDEKILVLASP